MQGVMRLVFFGYLAFLTMLLLVPDPLRFVGQSEEPAALLEWLMPIAHLLSFCALAVLALLTRWPMPRWLITVLLATYGGMTEIMQSFLPPRTAEWGDWLQDLAGIGLGAVMCWSVALAAAAVARWGRDAGRDARPGTSEWEVVQSVMSRSAAGSPSWWN